MFYEKSVLKKFAKFTGTHLCRNFFFDKVAGGVFFNQKSDSGTGFPCEFSKILKNNFFTQNISVRLLLL